MIKKILAIAGLTALLFLSLKQYLALQSYNRYRNIDSREQADVRDSVFSALEKNLVKANTAMKNSVFYYELGQLYLQRAYRKNDLNQAAARDRLLDKAIEAFRQGITRNAIDAYGFNALGYAYQLYNYPLFTYMEKGRLFMRRALEIRPKDDFLTTNIMYVFLRQWNYLSETEKKFVFTQLKRKWWFPPRIFWPISDRWKKDLGNFEAIKQILSQDSELWPQISEYFK